MDTYDTEYTSQECPNEQNPSPLQLETPNAQKDKAASPFADSPYVSAFVECKEVPHKSKAVRKQGTGKRLLIGVLVFALLIGSCVGTGILVGNHYQTQFTLMQSALNEQIDVLQSQIKTSANTGNGNSNIQTTPDGNLTPAQVYEKTHLAVVEVSIESTVDMNGTEAVVGSMGTGFIISSDGFIVSNYHVIQGAETITIKTGFGETYEAEIVGYDEENDFSLLKIEDQDLPCVKLGKSDDLIIGDQVVAIGYPLGNGSTTLTVGYISAKDRVITTDGKSINMLQTDAAINSGNSGGPLLNMQGEVIGITTAKSSGTSSSGATIEGVGYAIPTDDIIRMISDLQEYGYITGAYLGIWVRDVDVTAQSYGLPAGAYVEDVMEGYAAQRAGLQSQDIIVNIGGYDVTGLTDLTLALRKLEAGQTVTVTVYRNGREIYLSLTLDEKPQEAPTKEPEETAAESSESLPEDETYPDWYDFWDSIFKHWAD